MQTGGKLLTLSSKPRVFAGVDCNQAAANTEVAKNPGPRIVYPAVSSLPRIYRSVANPPSSSFPYQPRAPPSGNLPVGATTHYPQRSVFSAPIIEHARSDHHQPHTVQSHPVHPTHSLPGSQSVHPVQSVHPSQSVQQSQSVPQSVPQSSAIAPADLAQQEASSRQVTSQQVTSSHATPAPSEGPAPVQPAAQTPFNVVTSGESQPIKRQGSKPSPENTRTLQHSSSIGGSFSQQISPFVTQADNQVHIQQQQSTHNHSISPDSEGQALHQGQNQGQGPDSQPGFQQGNLSRSGSFTYASAYPPTCFPYPTSAQQDPSQEHANYASNMHSLMSTQGSSAWAAYPQHHHQQQRQQQQPHPSMSVQSWPGYNEGPVRASPRHPGWQMQGDKYGPGMDRPYSASSQWDSQQSQFSVPSEWQDQQTWQHSDGSGQPSFCMCLCTNHTFFQCANACNRERWLGNKCCGVLLIA